MSLTVPPITKMGEPEPKTVKEYVLILCHNKGQFLFVNKNRPEWQKGKTNLIGGKVEPNETAMEAAHRECSEEVGFEPKDLQLCGEISDSKDRNTFVVYCFKAEEKWFIINPQEEEDYK